MLREPPVKKRRVLTQPDDEAFWRGNLADCFKCVVCAPSVLVAGLAVTARAPRIWRSPSASFFPFSQERGYFASMRSEKCDLPRQPFALLGFRKANADSLAVKTERNSGGLNLA
jgi:hypothetical protein